MSAREPLSDERLAEIRTAAESYPAVWADVVLKVLAEVDRLRAELEQMQAER